jgi:hypothetical protein
MNGQLSDHPLAELIQEISDARLSGVLRLAREPARAAVYFEEGEVIAALSNLRPLRLVEILRRGRAVEEARLSALVNASMSDEQAGLVLMRTGLLDEAALKVAQGRRTKEVLRELLHWTDGEWNFDPRVRLAASQQGARVDASALLVEAARNFPREFVSARLRDEETVAPAPHAQENAGGVQLLPAEAFVLSRVYEPMRLSDVVALGGLPEEQTRKTVYVLALCGLLERPERRRAIPLEALKVAGQRAAAGAAPPQTGAAEQPQAEPEQETHGTVEELLSRARAATHYDVLGVRRSATPEEVKRAYYSHARRLHPDRFRRDADEETRQRIDAAFARIAQSYETLKDATLRAAYDLKLSKQRGGG